MKSLTSALIILSVMITATCFECQAQAFGKVDTIYTLVTGHKYAGLRAYNDTLYFRADEDNSNDYASYYASVDGGNNWSQFYTNIGYSRPQLTNSASLIGMSEVSDPNAGRVWMVRGLVVILDTVLDSKSFRKSYGLVDITIHPFNSNVLFAKLDLFTIRYSSYAYFASTDVGRTWSVINLPPPEVGSGKLMEFRCDFTDPEAWNFMVDSDDAFGVAKYYTTHDSGKTYDSSRWVDRYLHGYFAPRTGIRASSGTTTNDYEPILVDSNGTPVDSLHWFSAMKTSLKFDSLQFRFIQSFGASLSSPVPRTFAFALVNSGVFACRVALQKRFKPDSGEILYGIVATADNGATWEWILEPAFDGGITDVVLDPVTNTLYIATSGSNIPDQPRTIKILRCRQKVNSYESEVENCSAKIFPLPAQSTITIEIRGQLSDNVNVTVANFLGQQCEMAVESITIGEAKTTVLFNIQSLATGTYYAKIVDKYNVINYPFVIIH